jgi:hypothetical protein
MPHVAAAPLQHVAVATTAAQRSLSGGPIRRAGQAIEKDYKLINRFAPAEVV